MIYNLYNIIIYNAFIEIRMYNDTHRIGFFFFLVTIMQTNRVLL